jgi:hemolysin III
LRQGFAGILREDVNMQGDEHRQAARHFPAYSRGEQWADGAAHVIGLLFGIVATLALISTAARNDQFLLILGASLYAFGLLAMFSFSAAYNLCPPSTTKEFLRRLDHAAIFLMISGTYTPLLLNRIGGEWGIGLLAFVWIVAIAGATMKIVFPRRWEILSIALYLGLGWSIIIAIDPMLQALATNNLILIGAGALLYSGGVLFHLWDRLPYQNAIWHFMVLAAAACHYVAILNEVAIAAT